MKLDLGNPKFVDGWVSVDLRPKDPRVMAADAFSVLSSFRSEVDEIRSKNLLEHLENPGLFFSACERALAPGGRLTVITDNAEFVPFYFPFWIRHTGIGAHALNAYAEDFCDSRHFAIFTKMHLRNFFEAYRFEGIEVSRTWGGARLEGTGLKRRSHPEIQSR